MRWENYAMFFLLFSFLLNISYIPMITIPSINDRLTLGDWSVHLSVERVNDIVSGCILEMLGSTEFICIILSCGTLLHKTIMEKENTCIE